MTPLVLVSGWAYPSRALEPLGRLLAPDPRFQDGNELVAGSSPAARLAGSLPGSTVLVGWSMGGMLAIEAALLTPERVRALVLVNTTPRFSAGDGFRAGHPAERLMVLVRGMGRDPEVALAGFFALASATSGEEGIEERVRDGKRIGEDHLLRGLDYLARTDLRDAVPGLRAPTLVCHARKDRIVPGRAGKWLAERVPGAAAELSLPGAHDLPVNAPGVLAPRIRAFLDALNS